MKVTYYGQSCLLVEISGTKLLFDPFITPNDLARDIDVDEIKTDYVLISHGHDDHIYDADTVLHKTGAKLISNYEVANYFEEKGFKKIHPMNHGGGFDFDFGRVTYTTAIHSSSFPDGSYAGNPGGFVIESESGNFYFSGDTALTMDMKLIGEKFDLSWAALCIGDNFTMGAADAAIVANFVGVEKVLGVHYDTFPPIEIDHDEAKKTFSEKGVELVLLPIGESGEF